MSTIEISMQAPISNWIEIRHFHLFLNSPAAFQLLGRTKLHWAFMVFLVKFRHIFRSIPVKTMSLHISPFERRRFVAKQSPVPPPYSVFFWHSDKFVMELLSSKRRRFKQYHLFLIRRHFRSPVLSSVTRAMCSPSLLTFFCS